MLDIQFLGTSAGIPTKQRNVSACAVGQSERKPWVLVDCGEGTQQQLLHTHWSVNRLSAVCITHVHGDHCYGLPGLIASAGLHKRTQALVVIAPPEIETWLRHTIALTDLNLQFELQFVDVRSLLSAPMHLDGFEIQACELHHRVPSFAYRIHHSMHHTRLDIERLQQAGIPTRPFWNQIRQGQDVIHAGVVYHAADFLIEHQRRATVLVGGDNDMPALLQDACVGVDVLVHEATYTQEIADKVGAVPMHSSAQAIAQFAQTTAVPHLLLTHFSARYANQAALQPLVDEASQHFHGNVYAAHDFAYYRLHDGGQLEHLYTGKT